MKENRLNSNDLRTGDEILEVDGVSTKSKTSSDVSELLKGKNGTEITIKIARPGEKKPLIKKFMRQNIQFNPVSYTSIAGEKPVICCSTILPIKLLPRSNR